MKIKNKLIAGGLMSVVACALVGSITGTFAWYQYSTKGTVSMHGISVGTSQNLQYRFQTGENAYTQWAEGNLDWATIKDHVASAQLDSDNLFKLAPVSNGQIGSGDTLGLAQLNSTWYGNPAGGEQLPETTTGFLQFTFYTRLVEKDGAVGTNDTEDAVAVAGKLFVTHIAGLIQKEESEQNPVRNAVLEKALRMHVNFGDAKYFVVNPADATGTSVTLSATLDYQRQYDWESSAATAKTYTLPVNGSAGTLVSKDHSYVLGVDDTANSGKLKNDNNIYGTLPADANGLKVTVTLWLEGFTALTGQDDPTTSLTTDTRTSNWWDFEANIDQNVYAGFELSAIKD